MFYIVVYDSPDDKRRRRLCTLLKNFLFHVQKSVFEGFLELNDFRRLLEAIPKAVDEQEDSIRVYAVPKDALGRIKTFGLPPLTEDNACFFFGEDEEDSSAVVS